MIKYDSSIQIGYGSFSLSDDHPFYLAAKRHDQVYDELIAGTSNKRLRDWDREFLANMMRIAAKEAWLKKDVAEGVRLFRQAWIFYRIVRFWAKYIRPELEAYRPISTTNNLGGGE